MSLKLTTLPNNLRIVTDHIDGMHSTALGIWIGVGTRNEDMKYNGAAHMVEHMLFKGTKRHNARQIAEVLENVGGRMNAYTSREITSYHAHVLKEDTHLALDLLADMLQHSTLPDDEVARERDVILQEIGMCADTPDDIIFDYYFETAWADQALGAPILGTADIIANMQKEALQNYITQHYTPKNIVISAAGYVDHEAFVKDVERLFNALPPDQEDNNLKPANYTGGERLETKDLEQTHVVQGYKAPSRLSDDYYTTKALAMILGGGMSSRLFQEVREKRGLAYAVYAFYSAHRDDATLGIYAGTAPEKVKELMPVIQNEIDKISTSITEAELNRAKAQLKSGLVMGRESMMSRADQNAKYLIYRNTPLNVEQTIRNIDKINPEGIYSAAQKIFTTSKTLCQLGPESA